MPVIWYEATVRGVKSASESIRLFELEITDQDKFDFVAGQFVTFDLPIGDKRLQRWKSYSIASNPVGNNKIELCISRAENGLGSGYFFDEIKVGSKLKFKGPDGNFTLRQPIDHDVVMICTGTGLAPFKSMIDDVIQRKIEYKNLHLIFGTRHENDIIYKKELEELAIENPGFKYDIVLSKSDSWKGYCGHVHQVYLEKYKDKRPDVKFYLCGWSKMIDEAVAHLIVDLGYHPSQVLYELYG